MRGFTQLSSLEQCAISIPGCHQELLQVWRNSAWKCSGSVSSRIRITQDSYFVDYEFIQIYISIYKFNEKFITITSVAFFLRIFLGRLETSHILQIFTKINSDNSYLIYGVGLTVVCVLCSPFFCWRKSKCIASS